MANRDSRRRARAGQWSVASVGLLAAILGAPETAQAQTQQDPVVTATPVRQDLADILNATQRANNDVDEAREYLLAWTFTNPSNVGGLRYRVSFDADDLGEVATDLVTLDSNQANDGFVTDPDISPFRVSEEILIAQAETSSAAQGSVTVFIHVFLPDDTIDENTVAGSGNWTFEYDFDPPPAPNVTRIEPGERTVVVDWNQPSASDLQFYEFQYCTEVPEDVITSLTVADVPDGVATSTNTFELMMLPCEGNELRTETSISEQVDSFDLSEGIRERSWVAFALLSQDESPFLNLSDEAVVYAVRTDSILDFFELQNQLGESEDGGFCFVATAAHGSYAHPVVQLLRGFRDHVLARLPFGRTLTRAYYAASPPLARAIAKDPFLASVVRLVLVLGTGLSLLLGAWLMATLVRRFWALSRRALAPGVGLFVLGLGLCLSERAEAQLRTEAEGDLGFGFEFKIGPYRPTIAAGAENGGQASWDLIYGAENSQPAFNLGGEIQVYRGRIGTVSVGGSIGIVVWQGNGQIVVSPEADDDGTPDGFIDGLEGTSTFNLIPLTLTLGYRFDLLMDRLGVPFAPYVRGGLAYNIWWNTRDDGALSRFERDGEEVQAIGGKAGLTATVGLALALNIFDRAGAAKFHATTGIRTSYFFFEGQTTWVDGFGGDGFDLSVTTWYGGLMLEL